MPSEREIEAAKQVFRNHGMTAYDGLTRKILEAAERERWQTIETAPLDGTEIDLWCANPSALTAGSGRVTDCHFHCGEWLKYGDDPEVGWIKIYNATHWTPVSAGPAQRDRATHTTAEPVTRKG